MARTATVARKTKETAIRCRLSLDGRGRTKARTGIPLFNHILEAMALHGRMDLDLAARGDLPTGDHHTVEDTAIVLGQALSKALGSRKGIERFGSAAVPMDESRATVALDLGGRSYVAFQGKFSEKRVGGFATRSAVHFLEQFAKHAGATIHAAVEGEDDHHMLEALFKALGVALRRGAQVTHGKVPSTKGRL